jgi:hypothetical protein
MPLSFRTSPIFTLFPLRSLLLGELAFKRMARPVRKRFVRGGLTGLRQRIRSQGIPRPRWSSAQPDPHKRHGVERHFLCQDLRVPD